MVPIVPVLPHLRARIVFRLADRLRNQHCARLRATAHELRRGLWATSLVCWRVLFLDSYGGAVSWVCVRRVLV